MMTTKYLREIVKRKKQELIEPLQKIINHQNTSQKSISDYPEIQDFLQEKFPDISVDHIPIYISPPWVFNKNGFVEIGGCFVPELKVVLVKSRITIGDYGDSEDAFCKEMSKLSKAKVDPTDIVLHEMLHAVSNVANRSLSKYTNAEEEFVYTNSIDYLKSKGMSEDEIVDGNFIPFFIQSVMSSRKEMSKIFGDLKQNKGLDQTPTEVNFTEKKYKTFINKHAKFIVPRVISRSREMAFNMIDLYHKYGPKSIGLKSGTDEDLRFSSIDYDCDY